MCDSLRPLDAWEENFPAALLHGLASRGSSIDLAHCVDDREDYFDFIMRLATFVGNSSVTQELFDFKVQTAEQWAEDPSIPPWAEP